MADCEHKVATLVNAGSTIKLICEMCDEILREHKVRHILFARNFYANAPDDLWIFKHCPMELKFMEDFEKFVPVV